MKYFPTAKTLTSIVGVAVVCGVGISAQAMPRGDVDIAEVESRILAKFESADADSSGSLSLDEFMTMKPERKGRGMRQRPHADAQDGERRGGKHRKGRHMRGIAGDMDKEELKAAVNAELYLLLDADGNGEVSSEEFAANSRKLMKQARKTAMFKHLDTNQDGLLSLAEVPSPAERLRTIDTDGDGLVTREERRAAREAFRNQ